MTKLSNLIFILIFFPCFGFGQSITTASSEMQQATINSLETKPIVLKSIDELEKIMYIEKGDLIVNFFATWCKPCMRELPYIVDFSHKKLGTEKVILVSLDKLEDSEKLIKLMSKYKIESPYYQFVDGNANSWIDRVHPDWSGAIPITIFINDQSNKVLVEREFESTDDLRQTYLKLAEKQ